MSAGTVAVWCGVLNGRTATMPSDPSSIPATLCIFVTSTASAKVISGIMVGTHLASIVLPAPGGPDISTLCPPATAISSARFAAACPLTSAISTS